MAKVASFTIRGWVLWFYSNDHKPPHFHAKKPGEWEVRVFFLESGSAMFVIAWSSRVGRPTAGDLKPLRKAVEDNRDELLRQWEHCVDASLAPASESETDEEADRADSNPRP